MTPSFHLVAARRHRRNRHRQCQCLPLALPPPRMLLLLMLLLFVHPPSATIFSVVVVVHASRFDLVEGITRLNSDVLELRDEIESSISKRCDSILGCHRRSYDECQSEFTSRQECPSLSGLGYAIRECGRGELCNGLFDYSISTVRIPNSLANGPDKNPTNPEVIEAVCYTRTAERWMVNKHEEDRGLWAGLGVAPPSMYFGSPTGLFRIFPARHSRECGKFDPRLRPWYQASVPSTISNTVKPRKVVILMDTSRSLNEPMDTKTPETKLSYMKKAVTSTIATLSERAQIAVIRFGEFPSLVGRPAEYPPLLWRQATWAHKKRVIEDVGKIEVRGRSNWVAAFKFAFALIDDSLRYTRAKDEKHSCELENIAFLFFSDGEYNIPAETDDDNLVELVSKEVKKVESQGDYQVHSFWYTLGNKSPEQSVEKRISCAVDGYWTPVMSAIAPGNVTTGYQQLFSTPMGTEAFRNYTSWSSPYNFSTSGELGYTVSSLVYNRDVEPPRFMGAVGMDIGTDAAQKLYGGTMDETLWVMSEIINGMNERDFNTTCEQQRINLTYCETQSMRQLSGGNAAICLPEKVITSTEDLEVLGADADAGDIAVSIEGSNVTTNITEDEILGIDVAEEEPTESEVEEVIFEQILNCSKGFLAPCAGYDEYPENLWNNVELQGMPYLDRVCCKVGTNTQSDDCPKLDVIRDTKISDAAIFGLMFGSLLVAEILGCFFCFHYRKRRNST